MARISATDVEDTLSSRAAQKVNTSDLKKAVQVGHAIVEKADTAEYDTTTLELAEAEAAAHWIVANKTKEKTSKTVGDGSVSYAGSQGDVFGSGLESTTHGQTLTTLIPTIKDRNQWTVTTQDVGE